jgi:hypothetical protein
MKKYGYQATIITSNPFTYILDVIYLWLTMPLVAFAGLFTGQN